MRNGFSSRLGFFITACGSAVGLGNIWKFPYITGNNGGGAFIAVYLIAVLATGIPVLLAELAIGANAKSNPVAAFKELAGPETQIFGWLGVITSFFILSVYTIIGSWITAYLIRAILGEFSGPSSIEHSLSDLINHPGQEIFWVAIFVVAVCVVVLRDVKEGIERWNKILMPSLIVLLLGMVVYSMFLPGFSEACQFMFYFDISNLKATSYLEAISHSFFTLSVSLGIMITYGSFLSSTEGLCRMTFGLAICDTVIALAAGIVIFTAVFSYGHATDVGPKLIFEVLPAMFRHMPGGHLFSSAFFLFVAFTALTSAVSLMEVLITFGTEHFGYPRRKVAVFCAAATLAMAMINVFSMSHLPVTIMNMSIFDTVDYTTTKLFMPITGLGTILVFGWRMKQVRVNTIGSESMMQIVGNIVVRFLTPALVFVVLICGLFGPI